VIILKLCIALLIIRELCNKQDERSLRCIFTILQDACVSVNLICL